MCVCGGLIRGLGSHEKRDIWRHRHAERKSQVTMQRRRGKRASWRWSADGRSGCKPRSGLSRGGRAVPRAIRGSMALRELPWTLGPEL